MFELLYCTSIINVSLDEASELGHAVLRPDKVASHVEDVTAKTDML